MTTYPDRGGCKAIVLSGGRRGSTLLLHLLSSHPQIFCLRTGLFGRGAQFRKYLGVNDWRKILKFMWNAHGFDVGIGKISYSRMRHEWLWGFFAENDVSVIHLTRENALRTVVSIRLFRNRKRLGEGRPWATMVPLPTPKPAVLNVNRVLNKAVRVARDQSAMHRKIKRRGLRVMLLTYEQMVGPTGEIVDSVSLPGVCEFLGIEDRPLVTMMRRVNPEPLSKLVANYSELEAAARERGLEGWLDV